MMKRISFYCEPFVDTSRTGGYISEKTLIVCAGGMSSLLVAKKVTALFQTQGTDIEVAATSVYAGQKAIEDDQFDLYLVSPQTRMYFDNLAKFAHRS